MSETMPQQESTKEFSKTRHAAGQSLEQFFNQVTDIELSAAALVAKHEGTLALNGLLALSDTAAEALATHKGRLELNGLSSLSDSAAVALSKHDGDILLMGLKSLSDSALLRLAKCPSAVILREELAVRLAENPIWNKREIKRLTRLTDSAHHVALVSNCEVHGNDKYTDTDIDGCDGFIDLSHIRELSAKPAEALTHYDDTALFLKGLESLSPQVAEILSQSGNALYLEGLRHVSLEVARLLAQCRGVLFIGDVRRFPQDIADILWDNESVAREQVYFLHTLTDPSSVDGRAIGAFFDKVRRRHWYERGDFYGVEIPMLDLSGLTNIDIDTAEFITNSDGYCVDVDLSGLATLSEDVAQVLAENLGDVLLPSAVETDAIKMHLARNRGWAERAVKCISQLSDSAYHVRLASTLGTNVWVPFDGGSHYVYSPTDLDHLCAISLEAAQALADSCRQTMNGLLLGGLRELTPDVARALSTCEGPLHLTGLTGLQREAARELARHTHELRLGPLQSFSPDIVQELIAGNYCRVFFAGKEFHG